MLNCNDLDRGSKFALTRKCAHFHLVSNRMKNCKTTVTGEKQDEYY